jgi:hypothetical protein
MNLLCGTTLNIDDSIVEKLCAAAWKPDVSEKADF